MADLIPSTMIDPDGNTVSASEAIILYQCKDYLSTVKTSSPQDYDAVKSSLVSSAQTTMEQRIDQVNALWSSVESTQSSLASAVVTASTILASTITSAVLDPGGAAASISQLSASIDGWLVQVDSAVASLSMILSIVSPFADNCPPLSTITSTVSTMSSALSTVRTSIAAIPLS